MDSNGGLFDLNVKPDSQDQQDGEGFDCASSEQPEGICSSEVPCRTVIDVDAFDDDVLPSSWKSFREARKRSQKRHRTITGADAEAEGLALLASAASITAHNEVVERCQGSPMHFPGNSMKRISVCQQLTFNNQIEFIDLEASPRIHGKKNALEPEPAPQQVPATVAPTFCCPICMDNLKTETSTKCGHIFCEECIKKALAKKKWCPVCRKKLRAKDIFRVYLPDVSRV